MRLASLGADFDILLVPSVRLMTRAPWCRFDAMRY